MKIKIITLVFLGTLGSLSIESKSLLEYEEPMTLCLGDIVFNSDIDPDLCLYYKGNQLQIDNNHDKKPKRIGQDSVPKELVRVACYSLQEVKAMQEFYILVCCSPRCASKSNTVMYYHVPYNVSYKLYKLTAARKYNSEGDAEGCMWAVAEVKLQEDRIVPDNTIIFLFNADHVEGLKEKSWPLNSNIRLLPTIMIKKSIEVEAISRAIIEERILGIDFNTVHYHYAKDAKKRENKTVVTVAAVA